jgi:hypothetical protein
MNERPIPEAAFADQNSVEMLRVWIAEGKLHTSLKIGMYRETMKISEESAWGRILADTARHIANALEEGYSCDAAQSLELIVSALNAEIGRPSTEVKGSFVDRPSSNKPDP